MLLFLITLNNYGVLQKLNEVHGFHMLRGVVPENQF